MTHSASVLEHPAETLPDLAAPPAPAPAKGKSKPARPPQEKLSPVFYTVWFGQAISMFGTMLTSFGLGVWLFQRTGSVLDFTQLTLFSTAPALLLLPWTGSLADRIDRRRILIACDGLALCCVATIGVLVWLGRFELWQLFTVQTLLSVGMAFQGPAAYAAITSIVQKSQFGRANGMFGLAGALSQIAAPLLAAGLLGLIGLSGIIVLDILTFYVALSSLAIVELPPPAAPATGQSKRSPLRDLRWSLDFLRQRPAMAMVYGYTSMGGFMAGMVMVLVTPLVLAVHSAESLAWITTCGALGALLSGLVMAVWGGPRRFTPLVLSFNLLAGLGIAVAGATQSVALLCGAAFVVMLSTSTLGACMQAVWRRKVPRERQGSFAALQQAVQLSLIPLSALAGGALAHHVFEPALMPGGLWFDSIGAWFGAGKGRGTGFFFVTVGLTAALISAWSLLQRRLYRLETEVPDAF
ncbi:MFS transporter [Duganella callida]|uniref:MFS transporter n=1 Tax=Duganella callida TaxID=2561932 RepID=A0A4Y9SV93_9BURK|nr:MFS transporter [Duganella callida]TFW29134.1 MFS transporter [Duganella callida]